MKEGSFYICTEDCEAYLVDGYVDDDIGVWQRNRLNWTATHLETGRNITPKSSKHQTPEDALREGRELIAKRKDYVNSVLETESHRAFVKSRLEQTR